MTRAVERKSGERQIVRARESREVIRQAQMGSKESPARTFCLSESPSPSHPANHEGRTIKHKYEDFVPWVGTSIGLTTAPTSDHLSPCGEAPLRRALFSERHVHAILW